MPIQPATLTRSLKTKTDTWDKVVGLNYYETKYGPAICLIHERRTSTPRKDTVEVYRGPILASGDAFLAKKGIPYILIFTVVSLMSYCMSLLFDYEDYCLKRDRSKKRSTKG